MLIGHLLLEQEQGQIVIESCTVIGGNQCGQRGLIKLRDVISIDLVENIDQSLESKTFAGIQFYLQQGIGKQQQPVITIELDFVLVIAEITQYSDGWSGIALRQLPPLSVSAYQHKRMARVSVGQRLVPVVVGSRRCSCKTALGLLLKNPVIKRFQNCAVIQLAHQLSQWLFEPPRYVRGGFSMPGYVYQQEFAEHAAFADRYMIDVAPGVTVVTGHG